MNQLQQAREKIVLAEQRYGAICNAVEKLDRKREQLDHDAEVARMEIDEAKSAFEELLSIAVIPPATGDSQ